MNRARTSAARLGVGMLAAIGAAVLACRQGQPANDPKPEPNSPVPSVDRPDDDGTTTTTSSPLPAVKRDAG